jgi:hypothetical protein
VPPPAPLRATTREERSGGSIRFLRRRLREWGRKESVL